jgi:hypothetical protein
LECGGKHYITYSSKADWIKIWDIADVHLGNGGTAVDLFKRDIQIIKDDPFSFWFGGGDYGEYISPSDKRFDPTAVSKDITVHDLANLGFTLSTKLKNLLLPISKKCIGLLCGNHERKYSIAKEQENLHAWLCTELQVPNFGYTCIFDVVFVKVGDQSEPQLLRTNSLPATKRHEFRVFAHHGAGYSQSPGGKVNRLIKFMQDFDADIYFCSHVHDQIGKRLVQIGVDSVGRKIIDKVKIGIISGSYLRTYAAGVCTYGEQRGYSPVPLGMKCIEIKPFTRETRAAI